MTEQKAKALLKEMILPNGDIYGLGRYASWQVSHPETARLDGDFNAEELAALAWWMKNRVKRIIR